VLAKFKPADSPQLAGGQSVASVFGSPDHPVLDCFVEVFKEQTVRDLGADGPPFILAACLHFCSF
jgi:hypothetical protein